MRLCGLAVGAVVMGLLPAGECVAQSARRLVLGPETGTASEQFTQVTSVRELADGSALVADRLETRLVHVRWAGGSAQIGGTGRGPGEYRGIGVLRGLAADSTLFVDPHNARWLILNGPEVVATRRSDGMLDRSRYTFMVSADTIGHVLAARPFGGGMFANADSLHLLLVSRETGVVDTLTTLQGPGRDVLQVLESRPGQPTLISTNPFVVSDDAILLRDGWVAVARVAPYRVDWIAPNGRRTEGALLPVQPVDVNEEEKCWAMARMNSRWRDGCDPSLLSGWPTTIPAFIPERTPTLLAGPDGSVVVGRTVSASHPRPRYDFVDRDGRLVGTLELEADQRLVGFGVDAVYVLSTDVFDLQTLRRYVFPG